MNLYFILDGEPQVKVASPLIDVPVVNVTKRPNGRDVLGA